MGAGRVMKVQLVRQMSGVGQYGVESEVRPYVAVALVLACTGIFVWEM